MADMPGKAVMTAWLASDPYRPGKIADIEHSLIGACLLDVRGIKVWPLLNPDEFYMERHRKIWTVMLELAEKTDNPDALLLADELMRRGELEEVGGVPKLAQMTEEAINVIDIGYYGRRVREAAKERDKIMLAAALFQRPDMSSEEIEAVLAKLETGSAVRAPLLSESWLAEQERLKQNPPVKTGYKVLDSLIQGCSRGKMIVVGGRTSHGKTVWLTDFTRHAAHYGHSVDYLSLEETSAGVHARWIAQEAVLPVWAVSQGRLGPVDRQRADAAVEELQVLPLTALTVKRPDEASIVAAVKSSRAEIFVLDHLQMAVTSGREPRTYGLERVLNRIASVGVVDNKIVIVASQLSREMDKRRDAPLLSDLRDCLPAGAFITTGRGERMSVQEIVDGARPLVFALDEKWKLVQRRVTDIWPVGEKRVVLLRTRTGRVLRCSDGHRLFTPRGWCRAGDLCIGEAVAVPRKYEVQATQSLSPQRAMWLGWMLGDGSFHGSPTLTVRTLEEVRLSVQIGREEFGLEASWKREHKGDAFQVRFSTKPLGPGRNPATNWLRQIGVWGMRAADKDIPRVVFHQPNDVVIAFLRGLFHADGSCPSLKRRAAVISLSSISERLSRAAQSLLTRLGFVTALRREAHGRSGYETKTPHIWRLVIGDRTTCKRFVSEIGFIGEKQIRAMASMDRLETQAKRGPSLDELPFAVQERIARLKRQRGLSHSEIGWRDQGKNLGRDRALKIAEVLEDEELRQWAQSDLLWDPVVAIENHTAELMYDIAVENLHSLCVDDILTHNSGGTEQAGRLIFLLYWPRKYHADKDPSYYELEVAKNTEGPTGRVVLTFDAITGRFHGGEGFAVERRPETLPLFG
jgi:replicative DNA helicase